MEISVGIISACLPTMRPLFRFQPSRSSQRANDPASNTTLGWVRLETLGGNSNSLPTREAVNADKTGVTMGAVDVRNR